MKQIHFKLAAVLVLAAALMSGCGLKKMAKKYNTVKYEATPKVLETHGGKINTAVKGVFPAKYFDKKTTVEFTPVLKWEGGSYTCKSTTIQGEKVVGGNGTIVKKKEGGSFSWADVIAYKPEMNASELVVNAVAKRGKKSINLGEIKLADGVIYTSERVGRDEELALADHGYQKEVLITKKASLFFNYNDSKYSDKQKLNTTEDAKKLKKEIEDFIAKNWKIKSIDINAWASPEGEDKYNADLSNDRGKVAQKYVQEYIDKLDKEIAKTQKKKIEEVKRNANINMVAKGEDFEGFMTTIQKTNIPEKQAIINVIKSQGDKAKREQEIKNMTVVYAQVEEVLEPLRRADIAVICYEPKRTDENIAKLSTTAPDSLKAEELLFAATLTKDLNTQYKIYESGTKLYKDNWKFWNNAGYILLTEGKLSEATPFIEKANALSPNNEVVLNNMGVIASWNKDYAGAKAYYEKAQGKINQGYNLGILKIREGDYAGALSSFGNKTCKYNIALAQLLSGNASGAAKTLECVKPQTPQEYYLLAVVGARTQNTSMMIDNLKKAIVDPKLKAEAKADREFMSYFTTTDFQNLFK